MPFSKVAMRKIWFTRDMIYSELTRNILAIIKSKGSK
jgi:hypothetical protein